MLIETVVLGKNISEKLKIWQPLKGLIGGFALIILTLIFSIKYLGLGLNTIENCLVGNTVNWYDFIIKSIFTSITLNFGGSGGIITPVFFTGATAGSLFGSIFRLNLSIFSALGMVSLLTGAANTPIAASIMAVELFGPKIAPYAAIACIISFLMTGHRSLYPSQVLSIKKSPYFDIKLGKEIDKIDAFYRPGMHKFRKAMDKFWKIEEAVLREMDDSNRKL